MTAQTSTENPHERANIYHLYGDIGWMAFAFAMEWFYLQVYAIHLGATALHIGFLTAGRALLMVAGSGLANRWSRRFSNPIKAISAPLLGARILLYLMIAFVPFLPSNQVDVLVLLALLSAIPTGISQGVFLGMMPSAVSKQNLPRVVAFRSVLMNGLVLVCMVIVGELLSWLPQPQNYQVGFVIAFVVSFISWWHIGRIKTQDTVKVTVQSKKVNVWANGPFRRLAIITVAVNASVFLAASVGGLQLVRGLNASDGWISVFGICEMVAGALFTLRIDWLISKFGTRRLIIVTTFATVFQTLILAVTTTLPPYIIGELLYGAGWFAVNVLLYNRLIEIVPDEDMQHYASMYQILINGSLFIGPLVGTFLIENVMSIPMTLLLITGMRILAGVLAWTIRTEPVRELAKPPLENVRTPETPPALP